MATKARNAAASLSSNGGRHGRQQSGAGSISVAGKRPERTLDPTAGERDTHGVVGGGAGQASRTAGSGDVRQPVLDGRAAAISELIAEVHRVAMELAFVSDRARACHDRLSAADAAKKLTVMQRIELGDREAIYDCLAESCTKLDELREKIGCWLSDGDKDVLAALRQTSIAPCSATICSSRWSTKETATTDRGGKERTRSAASTGKAPARQG